MKLKDILDEIDKGRRWREVGMVNWLSKGAMVCMERFFDDKDYELEPLKEEREMKGIRLDFLIASEKGEIVTTYYSQLLPPQRRALYTAIKKLFKEFEGEEHP